MARQAFEESAIDTIPFFRFHLSPGGAGELLNELPGLVNTNVKQEVEKHSDGCQTTYDFFSNHNRLSQSVNGNQ